MIIQSHMYDINGLRFVHIPSQTKNISHLTFFTNTGELYNDHHPIGTSHFVEHMFFRGTTNRKPSDIFPEAARIGAELNAYTYFQNCEYYISCLSKYFVDAANLLCDAFFNSTFSSEETEHERNVILSEISMWDTEPNNNFYSDSMLKTFGKDNPFSRKIIGTVETVNRITNKDIISFVNNHYHRNNLVLIYHGDMAESDVVKIISALVPKKTQFLHSSYSIRNFISSDKFVIKDISKPNIFINDTSSDISMSGIRDYTPHYSHNYHAARICQDALGGVTNSILCDIFREKLALCYSCFLSPITYSYPNCQTLNLTSSFLPKNFDRFVSELRNFLNNFNSSMITSDLISATKNKLSFSLLQLKHSLPDYMAYLGPRILNQEYNKDISIENEIELIQNTPEEDIRTIADSGMFKFDSFKWSFMTSDENHIKEY